MVLVITHPHHLTYLLHSFLRSKLVLQLIKKFPAFGTSKFITVRTHKRPPPVPGLFCLQRKHLAYEYFITFCFSRGEVVSASPNPQAGGPPLVGYPRLLIQFIRSYPPYRRPFLHPQPEDTPCRGDRDPQTYNLQYIKNSIICKQTFLWAVLEKPLNSVFSNTTCSLVHFLP